jgi:hypothetical protein
MPNHRFRKRSPDDAIGGPNNKLRVDLYRRLIPQIAEQDQKSGAQGYVTHWNDPDAQWNKGDDIRSVWNALGLAPIIQTLFWVLETMEGEELAILESLDGLVDPFEAPEELLTDIAASFGYGLKESLDEETKRIVVQGLFHAYKGLGQRIGFDVFYRMVGFKIVKVYPLWKQAINEDLNRYSRDRYETTTITAEPVGVVGGTSYRTVLADAPLVPGSLRITDGAVTLKDQPEGFVTDGLVMATVVPLVGPGNESGSINYSTGELEVNFDGPTAGAVTADYERIDDEFPYRAARMDIEILMNPGGAPIPLVDTEVTRSILDRLDEVRPIHVLLRTLTLAFEIQDDVEPTATDAVGCTATLLDERDPFGGAPGLDALYFIDVGPEVPQDDLFIDHESGGAVTKDLVLEDSTDGFVCPGTDVLDIDADSYSQVV